MEQANASGSFLSKLDNVLRIFRQVMIHSNLFLVIAHASENNS